MTVERRDADAVLVQDTPASERRTIDAAVAEMLRAVEGIGRRLDELLVKHEAAKRAAHFAELEAHLERRTRRADFSDARARGFRP